jgi:ankyrin repeat protein
MANKIEEQIITCFKNDFNIIQPNRFHCLQYKIYLHRYKQCPINDEFHKDEYTNALFNSKKEDYFSELKYILFEQMHEKTITNYDIETFSYFVDEVTPNENTLLHYATVKRMFNQFTYLLENYPHLQLKQNSYGHTVLHLSLYFNIKDMVNYLINNKELINMIDINGYSCLHYALFYKRSILEEIQIKYPHLLYKLDKDNNTILHHSIKLQEYNLIDYMIQNNPSKVNDLFKQQNVKGNNCLHFAIIYKLKTQYLNYILENNLDLHNSQNNNGDTFLHLILKTQSIDLFNVILDYKKYHNILNIKNNDGLTPIDLGFSNEDLFHKCVNILNKIDN